MSFSPPQLSIFGSTLNTASLSVLSRDHDHKCDLNNLLMNIHMRSSANSLTLSSNTKRAFIALTSSSDVILLPSLSKNVSADYKTSLPWTKERMQTELSVKLTICWKKVANLASRLVLASSNRFWRIRRANTLRKPLTDKPLWELNWSLRMEAETGAYSKQINTLEASKTTSRSKAEAAP